MDFLEAQAVFSQRRQASKERSRSPANLAESHEQQILIGLAWSHRNHPVLKVIHEHLLAIPNGANTEQIWDERLGEWRSPNRERLIREGLRPGIPDLLLAYPAFGYPGFWLEMKGQTGQLSNNQKIWRDRLQAVGYRWGMYRAAGDAWSDLCSYVRGEL